MYDDIDLVKDVLNGSIESFNILIVKYEKLVYRFIYSITNNSETSKDITQEVFITVYNKLYTYRQENKFSNWIFKIAKNKCLDFMRKDKRLHETNMDAVQDAASKEESPEQWTVYRETERNLIDFINMLEKDDRQILCMRYSEIDMSFADIAQTLNMTESSVKKRFYRMRDRFKNLYANERSIGYGKL